MGAVGFVLISKLGTQQLLFRTDPRKKRRSKHWEIIADKSQERRVELGLCFSHGFSGANTAGASEISNTSHRGKSWLIWIGNSFSSAKGK
jgi:hypothetical protein